MCISKSVFDYDGPRFPTPDEVEVVPYNLKTNNLIRRDYEL